MFLSENVNSEAPVETAEATTGEGHEQTRAGTKDSITEIGMCPLDLVLVCECGRVCFWACPNGGGV